MANVFISYARRDRERVVALASALEAQGLSVWWDPNLVPGRRFREMIAEQLAAADSVVVVWTAASLESDWVQDEAEEARQRGVLVPVKMEPVQPPAGFRQVQAADLSQWTGGAEHPEFRALMQAVHGLAQVSRVSTPAPPAPGAILAHPVPAAPPRASTQSPRGLDPPWERPGDFIFDHFSRPIVWIAVAAITLGAGVGDRFLSGHGSNATAVGGFAAVFVATAGMLAGAARRASVGGLTKNIALGCALPPAVLLQCVIPSLMGFAIAMMSAASIMSGLLLLGLAVRLVTRKPAASRP